jgi:hypothetical protein
LLFVPHCRKLEMVNSSIFPLWPCGTSSQAPCDFHSSLDYSSGCWSSYATTPFMLPLFSHCLFFCLASSPFTLLLLSCCSSGIVLPFPFQAITSQPLLFFSHYHSRSVHIIAVMFCLVSMVLPMPLACAGRSSKARHQLNHQIWILLHIFNFFEIFLLLLHGWLMHS